MARFVRVVSCSISVMMMNFKYVMLGLCWLIGGLSVGAAEQGGVRQLDVREAEKKEVCHSMIGPRNTLIFYTFKGQQAILELTIGNEDESFPVSGRLLLFDKETTGEGLKKWINNQHSDGLYPEVPVPVYTRVLDDACEVTEHKKLGLMKGSGLRKATYTNYEVKLSMKALDVERVFVLAGFTDSSKVYVEVK